MKSHCEEDVRVFEQSEYVHDVESADDIEGAGETWLCLDGLDFAGVEEEAEQCAETHHATLGPEDDTPIGEGDSDAADARSESGAADGADEKEADGGAAFGLWWWSARGPEI